MTRHGGPGASVTAEVQLAERERLPLPTSVTLRIDGVALDRVALDRSTRTGTLSPKQTSAIVDALRRPTADIAFENGRQRWTISNEGANAVLLKMDAFQGRLDTVDALIRKGSKPASTVQAAISMPVVKAARVPAGDAGVPVLPLQQQNALLTALRAALPPDACDRFNDDPRMMHVSRLNANTLLASTTCWMGAANTADSYWLINARAPYSPRLVTLEANGYGDGVIENFQRGPQTDCLSIDRWTWDGTTFVHTTSTSTGQCRGIAVGGTWDLPTRVTRVVKEK